MNDPIAYGPTGIHCGCGKDAHSNLTPCRPDDETAAAVASQGRPRTMLDRAREALNARMTKDDLRLVLENVITHAAALNDRIAELENALAATGRSLSSFIFDSDDPGTNALGAQWLYHQAMPQADDPFAQPRAFRSSVFSEAAVAVEKLDAQGPNDRRDHSQAYLDGYSDGVQDAAERLEKLADQAAEGSETTEARVSQHYDKVPNPLDGCHWCACGNRWPCKHAEEAAS